MILWILACVMAGTGVAYAQYCYTSGELWGYPTGCFVAADEECSQFGYNIWCESWDCLNDCSYGTGRRCQDFAYLCITDPPCHRWLCA
jgi:hypothetical protein